MNRTQEVREKGKKKSELLLTTNNYPKKRGICDLYTQ